MLATLGACARADPLPLSPGHWVDESGGYSATLAADGTIAFDLPIDPEDARRRCSSPGEVATLHETGTWSVVGDQIMITIPRIDRSIVLLDSGRQGDWAQLRYYPCFLETPIVLGKEGSTG